MAMFGEVSGVHLLKSSRALSLASEASGFATAILSELEECYEVSIWLHVYGFVKVGHHVIAQKRQGKRVDQRGAQVLL